MLEARELCKSYRVNGKELCAVKSVSFTMEPGQMYALVGESGSGKSTLSQMLMGLLAPSAGEVLLDGVPLHELRGRAARARFARMQMVLQDGQSALDPRMSIYNSLAEPIRNLKPMPREQERVLINTLMEQVELPKTLLTRKPHELSGGQQKRVCMARALSVEPELLIFDEAVSGLDVIVRKNILQLLKHLQREQGFSCLFITHDMDVALYLADEVMVMKDGQMVEQVVYQGDRNIFRHSYSKLLLSTLLPE